MRNVQGCFQNVKQMVLAITPACHVLQLIQHEHGTAEMANSERQEIHSLMELKSLI